MAESKVCEKCGVKNPASNNFCEQCGSKLPAVGQPDKSSKPIHAPKSQKVYPQSDTEPKEKALTGSSAAMKVNFSFSWLELAYVALLLITIFTRFHHLGDK